MFLRKKSSSNGLVLKSQMNLNKLQSHFLDRDYENKSYSNETFHSLYSDLLTGAVIG